jgi:hypothetical protein
VRDKAVGLIRLDMTDDRNADEKAICELVEWNDIELTELLIVDAGEAMPTLRLIEAIHRNMAAVVVMPSVVHLGGGWRAVEETGASILCSRTVPASAAHEQGVAR